MQTKIIEAQADEILILSSSAPNQALLALLHNSEQYFELN